MQYELGLAAKYGVNVITGKKSRKFYFLIMAACTLRQNPLRITVPTYATELDARQAGEAYAVAQGWNVAK